MKTLEEEKEILDRQFEKEKELEKTPEYRIEKTKSNVEEFKKNINQDFESMLGISYDEYQKLSPEEQQQLIKDFHKKANNHSIVDDIQEGKLSLVGSGEESLLVRRGTADDLVKSEPKKLVRKKRRNNNQNN